MLTSVRKHDHASVCSVLSIHVLFFYFQYLKDLTKRPPKLDKNKRRRAPVQEEVQDQDGEAIELDVNLHCRDLTIRELEFSMVSFFIVSFFPL